MKVFYDTEFIEDGETIALISIGIVREDGQELYLVNRDMPVDRIRDHSWLMENVVPGLPRPRQEAIEKEFLLDWGDSRVKHKDQIARLVRNFILSTPSPELWAWYSAYDHVVLAQLFGRMIDLPDGIPMWTNDLRQECQRLGNPKMPRQIRGVHNALEDARHNLVMARTLEEIEKGRNA